MEVITKIRKSVVNPIDLTLSQMVEAYIFFSLNFNLNPLFELRYFSISLYKLSILTCDIIESYENYQQQKKSDTNLLGNQPDFQ